MSYFWAAVFVCLLIATGYCSYIGDDDVIYQFLYRNPTPDEALRRTRWVLLKVTTSVYGGAVVAAAVRELLKPAVLVKLACMALVFLLIGALQNGIRILRGRPIRPLLDRVIWQRSVGRLGPKR
jgi:hypothetical protein